MRSLSWLVLVGACSSPSPATPDAPAVGDATPTDASPDATADAAPDAYVAPAIVVSAIALTVTEGGTATLDVSLDRPPAGPIDVALTPANPDVALDHPMLTFDATTFATPQRVTLTAAQDDDLVDATGSLVASATGLAPVSVGYTITDDDDQQIVRSVPLLTVYDQNGMTAGGTSGTFTVRLGYAPSGTVVVDVAPQDPIVTVMPATLSFDATTWSQPQTVTVKAVEDDNAARSTTRVDLTSPGVTPTDVLVQNEDLDQQSVIVFPSTVDLDEGATTTLHPRLAYRPSPTLELQLSLGGGYTVTPPGPITFDDSNWDTGIDLSVTSLVDKDRNSDISVLRFYTGSTGVIAQVAFRQRDLTIVETFGSSAFSSTSENLDSSRLVAQAITVPTATTLDTLATYDTLSVALYADAGGLPGALVSGATPDDSGVRDVPDVPVAAGTYWLAVRTSSSRSLTTYATTTSRCQRSTLGLGSAWPATFGAATCASGASFAASATTFRQP